MSAHTPSETAERATAKASSQALLRAIFRLHARNGTIPPGQDLEGFIAAAGRLGLLVVRR